MMASRDLRLRFARKAGQATQVETVFTADSVALPVSPFPGANLGEVNIRTSGGKVLIMLTTELDITAEDVPAAANIQVRLLTDGIDQHSAERYVDQISAVTPTVGPERTMNAHWVSEPPVGTHTYRVEAIFFANPTVSAAFANRRRVTAVAFPR